IVRELFYNTPARMKFLKRDSVEGSYLTGAVQRQALGHPEIAFRLIRDGKPELTTPGDGKLISAIYAVMGRSCAKEMVEVKSKTGGMTLAGFVGKPTASRGSRSYQHFFVNGRYVKSPMMTSALEEAYKNQQMVGRFPICVLHLELPPEAVDVNVHPAKTEVKFLRESDVFDTVHYGVLGSLSRAPGRPEMQLREPRTAPSPKPQPRQDFFQRVTAQEYRAISSALEGGREAKPSPELAAQLQRSQQQSSKNSAALRDSVRQVPVPEKSPETGNRVVTDYGTFRVHSREETPEPVPAPAVLEPELPPKNVPEIPVPVPEEPQEPSQLSVELPPLETPSFPEQEPLETPKLPTEEPYRIIGQALDTYIIVEQGDGLLLIDKHAAHERILFERLREKKHEIMSQVLLEPLRLSFSREEQSVLLEKAELLEHLGFVVEDFGDGDLLVRAIPGDIGEGDTEACLSEVAGKLLQGQKLSPETVYDELLHTVACKAAIKGGQKSDPRELSALVAELMSRDDIKYCPHGRPVCIQLSRKTIERQFKRI
ncbi:MAG: DNA mismatch repair endonuclease MutL, partial [Oscillospiraceae bacterium]|nr:DNA mismatch repair endonuclease MutL [Oscillospiraceae bacterium]